MQFYMVKTKEFYYKIGLNLNDFKVGNREGKGEWIEMNFEGVLLIK